MVKEHLLLPDKVPAPPEFQAYWLERLFCERFNAPSPPLEAWPARKIRDYAIIMQVEAEVEAQRNKQTAPTGTPTPGTKGDPRAAEQAFEQMRAKAAPPPMPPPQS